MQLFQRWKSGSARETTASPDPMLAYFLITLGVRVRRLASTIPAGTDPAREETLAEIRQSLANFTANCATLTEAASWNEAYRLEMLFALIEPKENLWAELKRRLAAAAAENVASAARLAAAADALAPVVIDPRDPGVLLAQGETTVRSLLLEVLEDTHSTIQRKYYSRPIRKRATTRIVCFGLGAFLLFMLPYLGLYYNVWLGKNNPVDAWAWLPIYSVATTGLFGALFSRLLYLQSNWDALTIGGLKDAREFTSIILRGCVGMIGAVIVFFFLKSGVIEGGLFPKFSDIGVEEFSFPVIKDGKAVPNPLHLYYPSKDWALLVVWSFLAGFSERLVPSILRDTENSFEAPRPSR
jgi:hypothetical protein